MPLHLAMWSGPRNISTAMMRAFENRPDTAVIDEPLYAHYLANTAADHPGRDEVIAAGPTDWLTAAATLTGPIPNSRAIFYQKHMAHHLLPSIDRAWIAKLTNCFLIRDPREVLTSFIKVVEHPTAHDLGFPQQAELFDAERERTGKTPPVIDARDVLESPRATLTALCRAVGIPFLDAMLHWPPGPRDTDGVWAPHWYASVERSTGFAPYTPKPDPVPDHLMPVYEQCKPLYDHLARYKLKA
ncbi:MAG: hypothetical protein IT431_05010 [Phycisphaerales bacterium]|nr:hypothetical protein [Phycisphaerales bacterium]